MNNPDDMPLDVEAELKWLATYKRTTHLSLPQIEQQSGIPASTISLLISGSYNGNLTNQAKRIFQFRQLVESQSERQRAVMAEPEYVATPTSQHIMALLEIAHMGRWTVGAMGPGLGKTKSARHYASAVPNVWRVTMRESAKSLSAMMNLVMQAMKITAKTNGWAQAKSAAIIDHVRHKSGLLVIDEANYLTLADLEEIRAWHDETGLGIALLGNEELMWRIETAQPRHAYARIASRIANSHIQDLPVEGDINAYLDALDVIEPDMRKLLMSEGMSPRHGGLREVQKILDSANMQAIGDGETISAHYVRAAIESRATSILRRAA